MREPFQNKPLPPCYKNFIPLGIEDHQQYEKTEVEFNRSQKNKKPNFSHLYYYVQMFFTIINSSQQPHFFEPSLLYKTVDEMAM